MTKIIVGGIVTVAVGLVLAATTWNFAAVAEMPEKYMPRHDAYEQHQRIDKKLDKIYDLILEKRTTGE